MILFVCMCVSSVLNKLPGFQALFGKEPSQDSDFISFQQCFFFLNKKEKAEAFNISFKPCAEPSGDTHSEVFSCLWGY